MDCLKRTWAEIDIDALIHNFNLIKAHTNSKIAAVIKANAYGHGAVCVAKALCTAGAEMFAVSNLSEAVELRNNDITVPILILGYTPASAAKMLSEHKLIQTVYSYEYAKELSKESKNCGTIIECHLKLDTGMTRIGFDCRDDEINGFDEILQTYALSGLNVTGAFTHFATADEDNDFTDKQYERFVSVTDRLKNNNVHLPCLHCCNSAGILAHSDKHMSLVRPGIILYGLKPNSDMDAQLDFKPVMSFKSTVSLVKNIKKGDAVSYGRRFIADRDMTVATVSVGYADGYPRLLSNKGYMMINGKKAPILGSVCMDQTVVDVTGNCVKIGDEVTLFGKEILADEIAALCDTINYELVCGVSHRVPRVYFENGNEIKTVDYILNKQ